MKRKLVLLCLLSASPLIYADAEIKGTASEVREIVHPLPNTTSISGYAEEISYSDKAIVSLSFTTGHEKLSTAIETNKVLREKVISQILESGIAREEIHSAKFSSTPQTGWFGKKVESYEVVNKLDVGIYTEEQLTKLASISDAYKEIDITNTTFKHTKEDSYKSMVKQKALDKVNEEKKLYESSLGVTLVPVGIGRINVTDRPVNSMYLEQDRLKKSRISSYSTSMDMGAVSQESSFGEIKYEANASVTFRVEEPKL